MGVCGHHGIFRECPEEEAHPSLFTELSAVCLRCIQTAVLGSKLGA
jgi:hypothetical protein